jgi:hypothetical protein
VLSGFCRFCRFEGLDTSFVAVSVLNKGFVLNKYGKIMATAVKRWQQALNAR